MTRYLKINEVIKIHAQIIEAYGGINGIREINHYGLEVHSLED